MDSGLVSALIQLAISLGGSAVLIKLLTLRQDRAKIAGDASQGEANAAATLSGAALELVQNAEERARVANDRAVAAERSLTEVRDENRRAWNELWQTTTSLQWEVHEAREYVEILQNSLRTGGIAVPQDPSTRKQDPPLQPPPDARPIPLPPGVTEGEIGP